MVFAESAVEGGGEKREREVRGMRDYRECLGLMYFEVLSVLMIAIIVIIREEKLTAAALWLRAMDRSTIT